MTSTILKFYKIQESRYYKVMVLLK